MGEIEQPWVCTLSYVENCKDYNAIQKYHAKELKCLVSNETMIKSVIIIFKRIYLSLFQNCPHGRPTMRHLINLNMVPK